MSIVTRVDIENFRVNTVDMKTQEILVSREMTRRDIELVIVNYQGQLEKYEGKADLTDDKQGEINDMLICISTLRNSLEDFDAKVATDRAGYLF